MYVHLSKHCIHNIPGYEFHVQEMFRELYKNFRFADPQHDWPPFQPKQYVTLALIHYKGEPTRREKIAIAKASRAGKIDHLIRENELITADSTQSAKSRERSITTKELRDIFVTMENTKVGVTTSHTMLIEGAPGIGKTVLSIEIAYQWAIGKLLQNTVLVFHLKLRDPAVQRMQNVKEMLLYFYKHDESSLEMCNSCASSLVKSGGERIAVIFDGYDELPDALKENSFICNIINHKVLPKCTKVITSRPIASAGLHSKVSCRVEILGFTTADRNDYIQNALQESPDQIEQLKSYLNSHPNIDSLCYIPLNMTILLCLFKEKQQPPESQTELHEKFVLLTVFRHLKREGVPVEDINGLKHLPKQYASVIYKLSLLAHKCLVDNKIVFQYSDIHNICPNFDKIPGALNGFGLLQAVQSFSFSQIKQETSLNFLHYSVQEFLAAFHVANLNAFQQGTILRETFWIGKYFNMWIMYVGLTEGKVIAFKHFLSGNRSLLYSWISRTENISKQLLLDKVKCFHLFQVAQEANNEMLCSKIGELFDDDIIDFSHIALTPNNLHILGYVIAKCNKTYWRQLSLHHANIGDTEVQCFYNAIKLADSNHVIYVDSIDLSYNHLTSSCADSLISLVQHFNTTKLLFSHNLLAAAADTLIKKTILKELDVSHNNLGENLQLSEPFPGLQLAEAIQGNVHLEILNLSDNYISVKNVANALVLNSTIKNLNVANNNFKGSAVALVASAGLLCLDLSNNDMDSTDAVNLFKTIKHTTLKKLVIAEDISFISEGEFGEIADSLAKAKTLNILDINGCKVRQCDAYRFAVVISAFNPSVEAFVYNSYNLLDTHSILHPPLLESRAVYLNYQLFLPSDIVELGKMLVQKFTSEKCPVLELCGCFKTDAGCVVLRNTFCEEVKPCIECIDLTDNCLTSSCIDSVIGIIKLCSTTKLCISCNFLESAAAAALINNTTVLEMDLSCNNLGSTFADHLTNTHNLQILNVSHNTLGIGAALLISNASLVEINLSNNKLGLDGTSQLANVLKQNKTIKNLNISNNFIPSRGAIVLADALATHVTLRQLNISRNFLLDGAAALTRNTKIAELDVSHNNIGPTCAVACFRLIKSNSCLKRFSLQGSAISSAAADELAVLLATNTTLTEVDISECSVNREKMCNIAAMVSAVGGTLSNFNYNGKNLLKDDNVLESKTNKLEKFSINGTCISFKGILLEDTAVLSKMLLGVQLAKLDLGCSVIKDVGCEIMLNTLNRSHFTFIRAIDLQNCCLTSNCVDLIVGLVKNCGTLQLCVSKNSFQYSAAILIKQTTLKQLDVSSNHIDHLGEHLKGGICHLKSLNIAYNSLGMDAAVLVTNTFLTELDLTHNSLHSKDLEKLSEALKLNASIKTLNISNNDINFAGSLVMALTVNYTLKNLDISQNSLKDGVVSFISNTRLVELDVSHNKIDATTAIKCFKAVKDNIYIKKLSLRDDVKIKNKVLNKLAVALTTNIVLEEIDISKFSCSQRLYNVANLINIVNNTLKVFKHDNHNLLAKSQEDILKNARQQLFSYQLHDHLSGFPEDLALLTKTLTMSTTQIKVLNMKNCSIANAGCKLVYRTLNTATGVHINSINLSNNSLTSKCVHLVIHMVKHCKTTVLSISHNSFGKAIATLIKETKLVELDTSHNGGPHCDREMIDEIADVVDKNISLMRLDLSMCGIKYFVTINTFVKVIYS